MNTPVIVGLDGSETARSAVRYSAREAELRGADLKIMHVLGWPVILPPFHAPFDRHDQGPRAAMLDLLAHLAQEVQRDHPGLRVTTHLLDGAASAVLLDAARSAQLLVVGHRGSGGFAGLLTGSVATQVAGHAPGLGGFRGLLTGSTARGLMDHASCPVMVVPPANDAS